MNIKNKILFLHGLWGQNSSKPIFLKSLGFEVVSPILSDWSFSKSIEVAQKTFDEFKPNFIVGSSRGGAVAMNMETLKIPTILLAPAWNYFGNAKMCKSDSIIVHSKNDEIVSIDKSIDLAKRCGCKLIIAGQDHRLNCFEAKEAIKKALKF
jgi:alpha/beta superfamily hydrolase